MAETHKHNHRATVKVPDFLREPLEAAQARLEAFEGEAQRIFKDLMQKGKASRKDVSDLVHRLQKQDWHLSELRDRVEKLRENGLERAHEWRDRAESFRTEALERLLEMQSKAVSFLGVATRDQVEELSRELERLSKRLERGDKARRARQAKKDAGPTTTQI